MKEVFIISENEEIFLMISNSLSYLPVHFSWVGNMDNAENQFRSEKPDLVFFAVPRSHIPSRHKACLHDRTEIRAKAFHQRQTGSQ